MSLNPSQYFYGEKVPIGEIPGSNFGQYVLEKMRQNGSKIYQIDPNTDEQWTYTQTADYTVRVALEMKSRGIGIGKIVTVVGVNSLNIVLPIYASFLLGATAFPMHLFVEEFEVAASLKIATPDIIFCDRQYKTKIENVLKKLKIDVPIVIFEDDFHEFLNEKHQPMVAGFKPVPVDTKKAIAMILNTSGTTGEAKGVPGTHYAYYSGHLADMTSIPFTNETEVILTYGAISWGTSFVCHLIAVARGGKRIVANYDIEKHFDLVDKYGVNFMVANPTLITEIIKYPKFQKSNMKNSIKTLIFGGSPSRQHQIDEFYENFPNAIMINILGSTEYTALHVSFHPVRDQKLIRTHRYALGKIMPNATGKLIDPSTKKIISEPNQPGELYIKGPSLFKGYLNKPELNKEAFDDEGFYRSGDIFVRDEEGIMTFVGQTKDTFKYHYINIEPLQIENVVITHPAVRTACVMGKYDTFINDEVPVAFVVKNKGFEKTTEEDIVKFVGERVKDHQQLKGGVIFLDEFPFTTSGKIRKVELRKMMCNIK